MALPRGEAWRQVGGKRGWGGIKATGVYIHRGSLIQKPYNEWTWEEARCCGNPIPLLPRAGFLLSPAPGRDSFSSVLLEEERQNWCSFMEVRAHFLSVANCHRQRTRVSQSPHWACMELFLIPAVAARPPGCLDSKADVTDHPLSGAVFPDSLEGQVDQAPARLSWPRSAEAVLGRL